MITEVRLRDLMMPIWAEVYYELVFQQPCPRHARNLIVANADDVVTSLKATGLRHMRIRGRLTDYLRRRIDDVPVELPELFTRDEKAWYLQGAFFNTAVVQMSEAMTHLLLAVAQHEKVQDRLVRAPADDDYLDRVINEALRAFPLFGIAHRITTEDIRVSGTTVHSGSVLLFNYAAYQNSGFERPELFDPDRWEHLSPKDATFIPFGVTANRACPARGVAPVSMRAVTREVLRRFALASSVSHTRSIPHRGPCLLEPRPDPRRHRVAGSRRCGCATGGRTSGAAWSSSSAARRWCWRPGGCGSPAGTSRRPRPKAPCDEAARVLGWRAGGDRRCGAARPGLRHGPARPLHDGRDADEPSDAGRHGAHHRQAWPWPAGACCPVAGRAGRHRDRLPPGPAPLGRAHRVWRSCCSSAWSSTPMKPASLGFVAPGW